MSANIIQLQPFTNVVAAGIALCDLRNLFGYGIERVTLNLGGGAFTKSMITGLQLKANGKVIVDTDGAKMDSRNQWRGIPASANFLTLDFLEIKMKTKAGMVAGVIDTTNGFKDLRLEVTTSGATTPTLTGFAETCSPLTAPEFAGIRPLVARVHRITQTIGGAGTFPLQVPHMDPNSGGSLFKRIAIFSANMTAARIERNGIREWEVLSAAQNNFNASEYLRVAQAGLFMVDFINDGFQEDRILDTRPAAKVTTAAMYGTFSAGETITIEVEVLEPMDVY